MSLQTSFPATRPVLPFDLQIGDMISARFSRPSSRPDERDERKTSPAYIYGIYYKDGRIAAVDLMSSITRLKNIFSSDFVADTAEIMAQTGSAVPHKIGTAHIATVPNDEAYFAQNIRILGRIDPAIWPDLLIRRVEGIQTLASGNAYQNHCPAMFEDPDITRHGFTFTVMPIKSVRSGMTMPDMRGGLLTRDACALVEPDRVNRIARWSNNYSYAQRLEKNWDFAFPPVNEGLQACQQVEFCNWDRPKRKKGHSMRENNFNF